MGQSVSTLRGIVSNIEAVCESLRTLVCAELVAQGLVIVAKIKEFIGAFPWYYSTAFSVGACTYFLPEILNMMADWIRALRSAWQKLKYVYSNVLLSGSPGSTVRLTELEKKIEELEIENRKLEKLARENQDYAQKKSTRPFNIFVQSDYSQMPVSSQKQEKQPIRNRTSSGNYSYGAIQTPQCAQSYHVPIEFIHR